MKPPSYAIELARLTTALERAVGGKAGAVDVVCCGDRVCVVVAVDVAGCEVLVQTSVHKSGDDAAAELRRILRADAGAAAPSGGGGERVELPAGVPIVAAGAPLPGGRRSS